eukprot:5713270-Pyramimonas_sp.AAC.1
MSSEVAHRRAGRDPRRPARKQLGCGLRRGGLIMQAVGPALRPRAVVCSDVPVAGHRGRPSPPQGRPRNRARAGWAPLKCNRGCAAGKASIAS